MEDKLYKIDGYFVKEGKATKEDILKFEKELIKFVESKGFFFVGCVNIEEND